MTEILRAFFVLALLALPAAAAAQEPVIPDQPSPAATEFVAQFSDAHLTTMLKRIGARQQAMVALSQLHGQILAAVYDAEVANAVKIHGSEWQRNLARAWTGLMPDEELTSLRTDGATSPHSDKYQKLSSEAGQRMQTLSQDLFREILSETIQNTMKMLGDTPDGDAESSDGGEARAAPAEKAD